MTTFERGWTESGLRELCWWHRDSEFFAVHAPASEVTVDENGCIHTTIGLQCRVFPILRAVLHGVVQSLKSVESMRRQCRPCSRAVEDHTFLHIDEQGLFRHSVV